MIKITWHEGKVPDNLPITQVYGLIFTSDGRILVRVEKKKDKTVYSLAGGTPEDFDTDNVATLRRELIEEINTTIFDPILVGYQLIEGDRSYDYAQLRMAAIIDKIGPKQPDPDNGKTYDRLLTTPEKAIKLINWGDVGKKQIEQAFEIVRKHFNIAVTNETDEYV